MTENEWLTCTDPVAMLDFLRGSNPLRAECPAPPPSDRQLRLFACGCCRLVWEQLADPRSRRAVEVAERYADGEATEQEREDADWGASLAVSERPSGELMPALWVAHRFIRNVAASQVAQWVGPSGADILRCVFGNPFWLGRTLCGGNHVHSCELAAGWTSVRDCEGCQAVLRRQGGAAGKIASAIYDARDWGALPVLADCLEEAGCPGEQECHGCKGSGWEYDNSRAAREGDVMRCDTCGGTGRVPNLLLAHCRSAGPHARGCWVLDLILGGSDRA